MFHQSPFAGMPSSSSSSSSSSTSHFAVNSNNQQSSPGQHFQGNYPQAYMSGSGQNMGNFTNTSSSNFSNQSNHSGNSFFAGSNPNIPNRQGGPMSLSPSGKNFLPSLPGSVGSNWLPQQGGSTGSQLPTLSSRGIPQAQQNYGQGMQQNQYNQSGAHPSNSMQLPGIQMQFPHASGLMPNHSGGNMNNMLMNNQPNMPHPSLMNNSSNSSFSSMPSASPTGAGSPLKADSGEYKRVRDEKGSKKKGKKFSVPKNPGSLTVKSLISWKDKAARLAEEGKGYHAVEILKVLTALISKEPASFQLTEAPAQAKKWAGTGIENHEFPRILGKIWTSALNCSDIPMSECNSLVGKLEEWQTNLIRSGYGANASDKGYAFDFAIHMAKKKLQMLSSRAMMGGELSGKHTNQEEEDEEDEDDNESEPENMSHKRSRENEKSSNKKAKVDDEDESDKAYVEEYTRKYGDLEGKVQGGKIQIAGRLFHVHVYLDYLYNKGQAVGNKFAALSREQQAEVLSGSIKLT